MSCNQTVCVFLACVAALMSPSSGVAQEAVERVVTLVDIKSDGVIVARAGDLLSVETADSEKCIFLTPTGDRRQVARQHVVELKDAIPALDKLIEKSPKDARLHSVQANVYAMQGDLEKAILGVGKSIEYSEEPDATNYINRGVFYLTAGKHQEAIADFIKATHINNKAFPAYSNLASAYVGAGEYDKAIDVCSAVIKLQPEQPSYYMQRGVAYRHQKNWDAAIADFSKAFELSPSNANALSSRGFVYYLKGDHANAVQDFDALIKLRPTDAMAFNNRAYNRQLLGDYAQALEDYNTALSLMPDYAMALQNKAWLLATCPQDAVRDGAAAVATALKVCELRDNKVAGDIKALAAACAETGNFELAVQHQTTVVSMTDEPGKAREQEILKIYEQKQAYRVPEVAKVEPTPAPTAVPAPTAEPETGAAAEEKSAADSE